MIVQAVQGQVGPQHIAPQAESSRSGNHFENHLARTEQSAPETSGPTEPGGQEPHRTSPESETPPGAGPAPEATTQAENAEEVDDGNASIGDTLVDGRVSQEAVAVPVEAAVDDAENIEHAAAAAVRPAQVGSSQGTTIATPTPNGQSGTFDRSVTSDPNGSPQDGERPGRPPAAIVDTARPATQSVRPVLAATSITETEGSASSQDAPGRIDAVAPDRAAPLNVTPGLVSNAPQTAATLAPAHAITPPGGAAEVPAEPMLPTVDEANVARVVRGIRSALNQQGGTITLRMHPPDMGFVRVQLDIHQGAVRAEIASEHPAVRAMLSGQLGQLRAALESHGLSVDRLVTQALPSSGEPDAPQQQGHQSAADGRSRGSFDREGEQSSGGDDVGDPRDDVNRESRFEKLLNSVG